jgi:hypothetical protein
MATSSASAMLKLDSNPPTYWRDFHETTETIDNSQSAFHTVRSQTETPSFGSITGKSFVSEPESIVSKTPLAKPELLPSPVGPQAYRTS